MYYFKNEKETKFIEFDGLLFNVITLGDGIPSIRQYDSMRDRIPLGDVVKCSQREYTLIEEAAKCIIGKRRKEVGV